MARNECFEVTNLIFNFYSTIDEAGKTKLISDAMETYIKKYASNTKYKITHQLCNVLGSDVRVEVEFSKYISVNTVNRFLIKMELHIDEILYMPKEKQLIISVVM